MKIEDFWTRLSVGDCWEWTGGRNSAGYGCARIDGRQQLVHRVAWSLLVGEIPPECVLDHLCRNVLCVNPDHLEPVTHAENMRRGLIARSTHCPQGHAYAVHGARRTDGYRHCRKCQIEHTRLARHRKKERTHQDG